MYLDGQLSYHIWLSLPPEVRHKLVTLFDMPRTGRTVVEYRATGVVVTSDGFTPIDLQSVSLRRMQEMLGSDSDNYYKLFEVVVLNLDALLGGTFVALGTKQEVSEVAPEERVTSAAELTPEEHVSTDMPKFCGTCDSKGGRHKKVCPKYK